MYVNVKNKIFYYYLKMLRFLLFTIIFSVFCSAILADHLEFKPRIISLAPHITEMLIALEALDQLVGISSNTDSAVLQNNTSIPIVNDSYALNLEAIILQKPDLIINWCHNNPKFAIKLKELKFKVVTVCENSILDLAREIEILGKLVDKEIIAAKLSAKFLLELKQVTAIVKSRQVKAKPQVVFYYINSQPLLAAGCGTMLDEAIALCGGVNLVKESGFVLYALEQVIQEQPDLIVGTQQDNKKYLDKLKKIFASSKTKISVASDGELLKPSLQIPAQIKRLCAVLDSAR